MEKRAKPEILGGFRDFLPAEAIARQKMLADIREVYEEYGFLPLETPALERSSVLGTDSKDFDMEVYRFMAGENDVTLRFDLTVPLARVVAANPEIPKPFKRYQLGNVWRREKPQAGRFREFAQFDADIVGSSSMLADMEIIQIINDVMRRLNVGPFLIRFNNRKILNALPQFAGYDGRKNIYVLRLLDKIEKIGRDAVREGLLRGPENDFDESAPNLSKPAADKVMEFVGWSGENVEILERLNKDLTDCQIGREGAVELMEICGYLRNSDVPKENWRIDLSVARGLNYYTGPVFETTLLDLPNFGSVMSGGRYDGLVERFTGQKTPAVGASVGVDRLFAALRELNRLPKAAIMPSIFIANWDDNEIYKRLEMTSLLRSRGYRVTLWPNIGASLKEQIAFALKNGASSIILYGAKEASEGKVTVKMLDAKEQTTIYLSELFAFLDAVFRPFFRSLDKIRPV